MHTNNPIQALFSLAASKLQINRKHHAQSKVQTSDSQSTTSSPQNSEEKRQTQTKLAQEPKS